MQGAARTRVRLTAWTMAFLSLFAAPSPLRAQSVSEYQIKAAYVYNFAKFVEWPANNFPNPTTPIRICVLNDRSFEAGLNHIANGKAIGGRPVNIVAVENVDECHACHILFVNSSQDRHARQIIEVLRATSVLTVGETKDFVDEGGIIGFIVQDDRVQFRVNHRAANQAGLRISSRLLSLARQVIE